MSRNYKFTDIKSITILKRDLDLLKKFARILHVSKEQALILIIHDYLRDTGDDGYVEEIF